MVQLGMQAYVYLVFPSLSGFVTCSACTMLIAFVLVLYHILCILYLQVNILFTWIDLLVVTLGIVVPLTYAYNGS